MEVALFRKNGETPEGFRTRLKRESGKVLDTPKKRISLALQAICEQQSGRVPQPLVGNPMAFLGNVPKHHGYSMQPEKLGKVLALLFR